MSKICIIPARGGSKRIHRKNVRNFLGKPIIAYSIEAALNSNLFDEVMVSTDDLEIAEIAKKYGASVPFLRSTENSDEFATTFDVLEEVIEEYKKLEKIFDYVCCIYACAPFVSSEKLVESFQLLGKNNFDSVFPVLSFSFPIQRALKVDDKNRVTFFFPEYSLTRSQDFESSFHDAGQFYFLNVSKCFATGSIITENTGVIVVSELEGQDIDNEIDWKLAEIKYSLLHG